jgi:hypothetical protein
MTPAILLTLFAEAPDGKRTTPFLQKTEDWIVVGLLIGILLAAAVVFSMLEKWRKRALGDKQEDMAGELTDFRGMHERGEITDEEYARLREKVAARVVAPKPPPGPAPAGGPGVPPGPGVVDLKDEGEAPPGPPGPPGPPQSPPPPTLPP